jgi:hypothetical protein
VGAIHPPFPPAAFPKKSWIWKFSHLPEELSTSSVQLNSSRVHELFCLFFLCMCFGYTKETYNKLKMKLYNFQSYPPLKLGV